MEKKPEPIAVIGMSFKFPGGAETSEDFWKILMDRRCTASRYPAERFKVDAFWHPDSRKQNIINSQEGHFLSGDIKDFDAGFFSVSPNEAASMDPQHRGLMETTFHAFESAGVRMEDIAGTRTSVHVGCFTSDFATMQFRDSQSIPKYNSLGTAGSMLANRISWFYDLRGESMYIDTACSSSLVAMSLACQGLMTGASDVAVVGGSNIILIPEFSISLSNMNMLSPTGKSHSFDSRADGYGRGEGFATLILKPLSKAIADGNPIRALVRSIGTNQDGHTNSGITQPSKDMQIRLIRETYKKAGLDMRHTRFFESHGTGTPVGDPIEARAIGECFYKYRSEEDPIYVGAIKSNIGHLEGTSGLAGVVKTILALERGMIPPNANFEQLNPQIDAEFFHLEFPKECVPWPANDEVRRASVNSFGFGGCNSHAVLEAAGYYLMNLGHSRPPALSLLHPQQKRRVLFNGNGHRMANRSLDANGSVESAIDLRTEHGSYCLDKDPKPQLIIISASDEDGIARMANDLSNFAALCCQRGSEDDVLDNIVFTLNLRRSMLEWKSYVVLESLSTFQELQESLSKPAKISSTTKSNLGFVFTGQGAQWPRMGRELIGWPVFRTSLTRSQNYLDTMGCNWNLFDEILAQNEESRVNAPEFSQAITTAVQIALVDLTIFLGIKPTVVVGHSSGEVAAAYCAGFICHESAMQVSYFRGKLASQLAQNSTGSKWGMASIGLSPSDLSVVLAEIHEQQPGSFDMTKITMSCMNCPTNTTVSGPDDYLDILIRHLVLQHVFARKLKVEVGYHSPQMNAISSQYLAHLTNLRPGAETTGVRMVSSVEPGLIGVERVCSAGYWVQNMISPVRFVDAIRICCATSGDIPKILDRSHTRQILVHGWLEIGPHAALKGPLREIFELQNRNDLVYTSLLTRHTSASRTFLEAVGKLFCNNFEVDLGRTAWVDSEQETERHTVVDLPQYSFNHSITHWEESNRSKTFRSRSQRNHPLLGAQAIDWNPIDAKWCFTIRKDDIPWVNDHRLHGTMWYPAAGMVVMAIEAVKQLVPEDDLDFELRDVSFTAPIIVNEENSGTETQIAMAPSESTKTSRLVDYRFKIFVRRADGGWDESCNGTISPQGATSDSVGPHKHDEERYKAKLAHAGYLEALHACRGSLEAEEMYRKVSDTSGLQYGDVFRPLSQIQYDKAGQAVATLSPIDEVAREISKPFTIHPATLDGIFQLTIPALSRGVTETLPTLVPSRLSRLWISRHGAGLNSESKHDEAEAIHAKASFTSKRSAISSITVFSRPNMEVRVRVDELETTEVARDQTTDDPEEAVKARCHEMDWKADPTLLDAAEMLEYCSRKRSADPEPQYWHENIRLMLLGFVQLALETMAADNQSPLPSMERYMAWLQARLDAYWAEGSKVRQDIPSGVELQRLAEYFKADSIRGDIGVLVGSQLREVLTGEVDPLKLLFTDPQYTAKFYDELNMVGKAFPMLHAYLDLLVHKDPGLKFLEIGAGSGASTSMVLATIGSPEQGPRYEEYAFTDVSGFFFTAAQERFRMYDKVQYRTLDIEQEDLGASGFEPGSYDVIIAANVLHATRNLNRTLSNVRKLLKCGGKLILMETTSPDCIESGLVWGSLPGWWLGSESFRQDSPIVDEYCWDALLKEANFSGTEQVFRDWDSDTCHRWSIMVSSATALQSPNGIAQHEDSISHIMHKITLVTDSKESALQMQTIGKLQNALRRSADPVIAEVVPVEQVSLINDIGNKHCILLADLHRAHLSHVEPSTFQIYQTILTTFKSILWVQIRDEEIDSAPYWSMAEGLVRVCRSENPLSTIVTLTLESISNPSADRIATKIACVFEAANFRNHLTARADLVENEYMEISGYLCVNRLRQAKYLDRHIFNRTHNAVSERPISQCPPISLDIKSPGLLDTLEWREDELSYHPLSTDEVEVEVRAIGVNFKDCLALLGRVNTWDLGSECAGVVTRIGSDISSVKVGDRVAVGNIGTYKTMVRVREIFIVRIPDFMSFEEAAGVPTAFCTAYYSLYSVARLQKGESILIHAAAGGTGQAAVQIAKLVGAEIFATVGSASKKSFLVERYGIQEDHIFYSRDDSFADGVKRMTHGRGVDVILNSLSGKLLVASWELIADFGRFVEIGRKDIDMRGSLPMFPFIRNATFTGVDLAAIVNNAGRMNMNILKDVFNLMESGLLQPPYPVQPFPIDQAEQALRLLVSGKSSGKIVLTIDGKSTIPFRENDSSEYRFPKDATYVIAGGLGGLGRQIALWMARRGAQNLLLLTRTDIGGSPEKMATVLELQCLGVNVQYRVCDIAEAASLQEAVQMAAQNMPPIRGCFQAAMVIQDRPFATMSHQEWCAAVRPKVQGSWNLHTTLPPGMDFFVMLSSAVCIFGNAGQANYAAGNTFLDALARLRIARGEKAVAIDLGMVLDEGWVAERGYIQTRVMRFDHVLPISQRELSALFDYYCNPSLTFSSPVAGQIVTGIEIPSLILESGRSIPESMEAPLFRAMYQIRPGGKPVTRTTTKEQDYAAMFQKAETLEAAGMITAEALRTKLCKILGIESEDKTIDDRIDSFGVDSLIALEVRNWLAKEIRADLAVYEILGDVKLIDIGMMATRKTEFRQAHWTGTSS